jgi:hypothetical protein
MRRFALVAVSLLLAGVFAPAAFAQEHGQIGVGADYFRLSQTKMGFAGVGGHLSVNTNRRWRRNSGRLLHRQAGHPAPRRNTPDVPAESAAHDSLEELN